MQNLRIKSLRDNKTVQFGGTGYTLALNENLPIKEGMRIESLFKDLHKGIYTYGDEKIKEVLKLGYIESTLGFKLHLPFFDKFKSLEVSVANFNKKDWEMYREGKEEYLKRKEAIKNKEKYKIINKNSLDFYVNNKSIISQFFKLKSQYYRLTLNNPTQTTSAHQTKRAACLLFNFIKEKNHLGRVKICIIPHDEFVLEVEDELVSLYVEKLAYFMKKGGDEFINNPLIKMSAEAHADLNWYLAK